MLDSGIFICQDTLEEFSVVNTVGIELSFLAAPGAVTYTSAIRCSTFFQRVTFASVGNFLEKYSTL